MALPTPDISVYVHADYAETKWLLTTSVTSLSRLVIPLSHGQPNGSKINFIQRGVNVVLYICWSLCSSFPSGDVNGVESNTSWDEAIQTSKTFLSPEGTPEI